VLVILAVVVPMLYLFIVVIKFVKVCKLFPELTAFCTCRTTVSTAVVVVAADWHTQPTEAQAWSILAADQKPRTDQ